MPASPSGSAGLLVADAGGTVLCADLGGLRARGRGFVARGRAGTGNVTLKLVRRKGGALTVTGRGLDLGSLDEQNVTIGVRLGADQFVGGGRFHTRGRRWLLDR
jgi:hypothetical protein